MTSHRGSEPRRSQSAAAPSPFPPIADYAFLSNCHTGALVAPDGGDRLAVRARASTPRACSARLLDREAGIVPARAVRHQPSRPRASTSRAPTCSRPRGRRRPAGSLVRDALTMGPRRGEDTITPHTPAARRRRRRAPAGPHGRLPRGQRGGRAGLRAGLRLRAHTGRVVAGRRRSAHGGRHRRRTRPSGCRRTWRSASRATASAPGTCCGRASGSTARCPGRRGCRPRRRRRRDRAARRDRALLARLARPRPAPRPPLAGPDPALRAGHQGPDLHADGRNGRRAHHLAARDAGRRAQLGLPVHLDARLHVHAPGAALAQPRLGGRRVHAVRRRPGGRTRTARCRSCTASTAAAT